MPSYTFNTHDRKHHNNRPHHLYLCRHRTPGTTPVFRHRPDLQHCCHLYTRCSRRHCGTQAQQNVSNRGLLDTLGDRIVENTFWLYFTVGGGIPLWMPIAVMARGVVTDTLQRAQGSPENGWTHALTRSRISRGFYGVMKMLTFMSLASAMVFRRPVLEQGSLILATLTVSVCLLRGLPFLFFFRKPPCPRSTQKQFYSSALVCCFL